jgi:DNA-binding IclR family transcriptional regulator
MPRRIAEILGILNDGQWHLLAEIKKRMKLTDDQVKQIADFLREYDFVEINDADKKIKIGEDVLKFLSQTATS